MNTNKYALAHKYLFNEVGPAFDEMDRVYDNKDEAVEAAKQFIADRGGDSCVYVVTAVAKVGKDPSLNMSEIPVEDME